MKRHYSLLGWEYHDTCSDDEISTTESGKVKEHTHTHMYIKVLKKNVFKYVPFYSVESPSTHETPDHGFSSTNRLTPSVQMPGDSPNLCMLLGKTFHIDPNRHPVVVLTPLSPRLISSSCSPAPKSTNNENEHCYNFNSDPPWEPDRDKDSNSDFSITNDDTPPKKKQKIDELMKLKKFLMHQTNQKREIPSTNTFTYFDEAGTNRLAESKTPANNGKNNMQKICTYVFIQQTVKQIFSVQSIHASLLCSIRGLGLGDLQALLCTFTPH